MGGGLLRITLNRFVSQAAICCSRPVCGCRFSVSQAARYKLTCRTIFRVCFKAVTCGAGG